MNDVAKFPAAGEKTEPLPGDAWSKLLALARMVEFDEASGTLVIRNGKARILLRSDGTVRVEGTRIVQSAERGIALDAAMIDLN